MSFQLKNKKARIVSVVPVAEVHGNSREVACEIKLETSVSNDFLDKIGPSLKSFLYVKDKSAIDLISQDDPDHKTHLRYPEMVQPIKWDMKCEVDLTIGPDPNPMKITTAELGSLRVEAIEGGMVGLTFLIRGYPEEAQFGALCKLTGCEVPISIAKAKVLL